MPDKGAISHNSYLSYIGEYKFVDAEKYKIIWASLLIEQTMLTSPKSWDKIITRAS